MVLGHDVSHHKLGPSTVHHHATACRLGAEPLPRGEVVSKVWAYIKQHGLQNPEDRREILADAKLEAVFGKKKVTMLEMNKHLAQYLT